VSAPSVPAVFFEMPEALPNGRHALTREEVERAQRERLMRSAVEELAERGYANVKVANVCARAGVSRASFYALFSDKEDCLCEAHDRYIEVVTRRAIESGINETRDWSGFIAKSLDAYFDVLVADPLIARGFTVDMQAIGPRVSRQQAEALRAFAVGRMLGERRLRRTDSKLKARSFHVHLGSVQVQRSLAREALESDAKPNFEVIRNDLVEWFVAGWYG
jgi:AcrR family transcriptional regulator